MLQDNKQYAKGGLFALFLRGHKDKGNKGSKLKQNKQKHILDGDFKDRIHCCKIQLPSKGFLELRAGLHMNIYSKNIIFSSVFLLTLCCTKAKLEAGLL